MSALSSLLVQDQVLSVTHVEQALQRQVIFGGDLATNLLELGLVDEVVLADYLGRVLRLPVYPAEYLMAVDQGVLRMMPWKVATEHRIVPVKVHGDKMVIAAAGPVPRGALDEASFLLGMELIPNLVLEFRLAMALNRYYGVQMPARLASLQRKIAPDFEIDAPPVVAPPTEGTTLLKSAEEAAAVADEEPAAGGGEPARPDTTDKMIVVESTTRKEERADEETLKFITGSPESTNRVVSVLKESAAREREAPSAAPEKPAPVESEPAAGGEESAPERVADPPATSSDPPATPSGPPEPDLTSLPAPLLLRQSKALELLEEASGRDEILDLFLKFASQAFEFSVLMVVHGKSAQGRQAVFRGRPPIPAEQVSVPLEEGGMFANVYETKGYHLGPPTHGDSETSFFASLGREAPRSCALLPVVLRSRVILLFYGDSGEKGVKANRVAKLAEFARTVAGAFEKLLLKQKYAQYGAKPTAEKPKEEAKAKVEPAKVAAEETPPAKKRDFSSWTAADQAIGEEAWPEPSKPSIPAPPRYEDEEPAPEPERPAIQAPPRSTEESGEAPREEAAGVVATSRVMVIGDDAGAPAEPDEGDGEGDGIAPAQRETDPADRVTEPAGPALAPAEERSRLVQNPNPELVKRVEMIVVKTAPSSDEEVDSPKRLLDVAGGATVAVGEEPVDPYADSEPPLPPEEEPAPEVVEPTPQAVETERSVRVEMPEELERLVERVMTRGPFDEAAAQLLVGIGEDALDALMPHFPGPLLYDRYQESSRLRKVGKHGPLLKVLLEFGPAVAKHLVPLMDSYDSEMRFYAVFVFSEIENPEALPGLVKRLFDNDRQIRILAMDVIRRFSAYPEYRWAAQEVALVLTNSASTLEKKRMAAEALGELQDPVAIRPLSEMLGSVDGVLAERCQRALVKITFNDFGFSERRWLAWWQSNRSHHRIEWAMASINHRIEDIRNSALDELKSMVGDAVEWPRGPLDHKARREVKRMCLQWWEREGRALYPVVEVD